MMNGSELRSKTTQDLKALLASLRREQFKLRLVKASGDMNKTHKIKETRRNIAKVETILTEKEGKAS